MSRKASAVKAQRLIEVFMSAGSFSDPYYTFEDKKGRNIQDFEFDPGKRYRLKRADKASTNPFYISDQGWSQPATKKSSSKQMQTSTAKSSGQRNSTYPSKRSIRRNSQPLGACFSTAKATHRWQTNSSSMQAKGHHNNAIQTSHSRRQSSPLRQKEWTIYSPPPKPMRFPSVLPRHRQRRPRHGIQLSPSSTSAPDPTPSAAVS